MPDYRLAATRAARKHGVDPKVFLAMINQESRFNPNARSPKGARGIAQFMGPTAKAYGVNLNDNRAADDLEGAAKYLAANLRRTGGNYHQALSIYNSGRPEGYKSIPETSNYVRSILGASGGVSPAARSSASSTRTVPGVDRSDARQQLLLAYLAQRGRPGALLSLKAGLDANQDTPSRTVTTTRSVAGSPSEGKVNIAAGADRPGIGLTPGIKKVLREVAGVHGSPITVGTGTNHNRLTVNGNVSDHWSGNAADVPASGAALTRLGQQALIAAGMSPAEARKQEGGLFNLPYGKHRRIQVIFNTNEGGNHFNHLHVGVSPK